MLAVLIGCASLPGHAYPVLKPIGIVAAFASPVPGISLFGQFDDRWSGTLSLGYGADVRVNYESDGSHERYWTFGAGRFDTLGVVRAGYGKAWRRGPWRWHLEATLNLPFSIDGADGPGGLAEATAAAFTLFVPVGFGVHYVFGSR